MASPITDRRQGLVGNTAVKAPVTVVAAGNITLSGQQTIDGVAVLSVNSAGVPDRVLCVGQTNPVDNGIWDVSTASWTRSRDADGNYDLTQGTIVQVYAGSVSNAGSFWSLTTSGSITVGTSALAWARSLQPTLASLGLSGSSGSSLVGFLQAGTGAVPRTMQDKERETVSVKDFGAVGDGVADDTTAIAAAAVFLAANATRYKLVFPAGIYKYSLSPNWAIQNAHIEAQGEVRLRYTGTGNAVIIDGGAASQIFNMRMGRFMVEAPATALSGVYVRAVHHSHLGFNVRGAGSASAGIEVRFCVCTVFEEPTVSVNEAGWYLAAKPAIGIYLDIRNAGETVSYCSFRSPVVEGPTIGVQLSGTLGNSFFSGTAEGCSTYGVYAPIGSNNDKFYGTDFESNTTSDVYSQGSGLTLIDCESTNQIAFGTTAKRCSLIGGEHGSVLFDAGSAGCIASTVKYNRLNNAATFLDFGTNSLVVGVRNAATNLSHMQITSALSAVAGMPSPSVTTRVFTVTGAKLNDPVIVAVDTPTAGFTYTGLVTAADTITVTIANVSGALANLAAGTLKVQALRL